MSLWVPSLTSKIPRGDLSNRPQDKRLSRGVQWLIVLAFSGMTSLTFAIGFEWRHHETMVGWNSLPLTMWDHVCLLWLLVAKSVMLLAPLLVPIGLLIAGGLRRMALVVLGIGWFLLFYWMAVDLLIMSFSGNHAVTYVPFLYDMFLASDKQYGSWVGDGITYIETIVPLTVFSWGMCSFLVVRWMVVRLVHRHSWVALPLSVCVAMVMFAFSMLLLFPALTFFSEPSVLRRLDATLPLYMRVLETGVNGAREVLARFKGSGPREPTPRLVRIQPSFSEAARGSGSVVLHHEGNTELSLTGWKLQDRQGGTFPLSGKLKRGESLTVQIPQGSLSLDRGCRVLLTDPQNWPRHMLTCAGKQRLFDRFSLDRAQAQADRYLHDADAWVKNVELLLRGDGTIAAPADSTAVVKRQPLPNVIILVLESFRSSAVSPEVMRRLDALSAKGLRLERHYSGSNCTHMGFFSLLYGRTPIFFNQTLDRKIAPQMCETMRLSGYRRTYISGGAHDGFRRIQEFINKQTFDKVAIDEKGATSTFTGWADADRRVLDRIGKLVSAPQTQPQFVLSLLWSTHCPYVYPSDFQTHKPDGSERSLQEWTGFPTEVLSNRYKNAALFLEAELMRFISSLDLKRNILIITGDHGESLGEDGFRSHTGPASEVQTHVPFIMVGAGVQSRRIRTATGHTDILPTLLHQLAGQHVPIQHCHGRDLLAESNPADEALVVPLLWPALSKLVLVKGNKHVLIDVKTRGDRLRSARFAAYLDDSGMYRLRVDGLTKTKGSGTHVERAEQGLGDPRKYRP